MTNFAQHISSACTTLIDQRKPVVLLSVKNKQDRRLLKQFLSSYEVIQIGDVGLDGQEFDLCLLDEQAYRIHEETLRDLKQQAAPVFLPTILLARNKDQVRRERSIVEFADDVVYIPVSQEIMQSRIGLLLRQREYSLRLQKKNRELAEKNRQLSIFEQAINATSEGIIITDHSREDNPIVFFNKGFEELTGYSKEEVLGKNCRFLQNDDRDQKTLNKMRALIENKEGGQVIVRNYRKDGTMFWNELSIAPIQGGSDSSSYFVGVQRDVTQLVETQKELRKEKERYQVITENATDMISRHAPDGTYLFVSPASEELIGYKPEELVGNSSFDNIHPDDLKDIFESGNPFKGKSRLRLTFRKKTKSGEYKWVESDMRVIRDKSTGEIKEIQASTRDITARKTTLDKLRERVKEQKCLYNISRLFEQELNIDELLEKAVSYLPDGWQYPEITEAAIQFDGKTYKTKGYAESEWALTTESNRIEGKPLSVSVVYTKEKEPFDEEPFLKEERQLIDAIADTLSSKINRIISQDSLKKSEQRWEQLVNNDPNLIQISTMEGEIKFVNPAGTEMYGVDDPQMLIGENLFDLLEISESDLTIIKERMAKALDGEVIPPRVYKLGTLDGKERYVQIQSAAITLDNGEKGLQQVAQDITNRVKYEQELQQSLKEKETLLQEIHHRVKNNLAVVSGMLQLQGFSTDNEAVKKHLADSEARIKTMALIHEHLYQAESLSDIEFGSYVTKLIKQIQKVSAHLDNVNLDLDYDSFSLNVNQAVPCALILNELISNAYEHAFEERKGGNIKVSVKEKNHRIFVSVEDDGKGVEDITDRKSDSLGFTIVETLIQQLRAEYSTESADGFCFKFSFDKQDIRGASSNIV